MTLAYFSATGEGIENEEPRGWKDCWNEEIVRRRNLHTRCKADSGRSIWSS